MVIAGLTVTVSWCGKTSAPGGRFSSITTSAIWEEPSATEVSPAGEPRPGPPSQVASTTTSGAPAPSGSPLLWNCTVMLGGSAARI